MKIETAYLATTVFVGDVIRSEHFVCGRSSSGPVTVGYPGTKQDSDGDEFGQNDYDESRRSALFVVEEIDVEGPSFLQPRDDGMSVLARRLHDDGKYDPEGTLIKFWMSNHSPCIERVERVRQMRMKIFFE